MNSLGIPPVQLTHFDSEPAIVAAYAWSQDGKKFAITRARSDDYSDGVMFMVQVNGAPLSGCLEIRRGEDLCYE